jgi:hypothetical protein
MPAWRTWCRAILSARLIMLLIMSSTGDCCLCCWCCFTARPARRRRIARAVATLGLFGHRVDEEQCLVYLPRITGRGRQHGRGHLRIRGRRLLQPRDDRRWYGVRCCSESSEGWRIRGDQATRIGMMGPSASTLTQSIANGGTKRRWALTSAPSGSSSPARPLPAPPADHHHVSIALPAVAAAKATRHT